jgi:hypothetical protein
MKARYKHPSTTLRVTVSVVEVCFANQTTLKSKY